MAQPPDRHRERERERNREQRIQLAKTAARLMAEGGLQDFDTAKRKAAALMGLKHHRNLPGNDEIEAALIDYHRLFQHDQQREQLGQLRQTALQAMRLLAPFSPRLVGSVLSGSADRHSPIQLHLFADTTEELVIFLLGQQIPYEQDEQYIHYSRGREERRPRIRFMAGESALELTLFPTKALRQPPASPIDGQPMRRVSLIELQRLLEDEATGR
jgi:hypothetical protein